MKNPIISHLPHSLPRTGIMVTVGPTSSTDLSIEKMARAGATIFRFNAAQFLNQKKASPYAVKCQAESGSGRDVLEVLETIRRIEIDLERPLLTYLDLAGPKLRIAEVRGGSDHPALKDPVRVYLDPVLPRHRENLDDEIAHIFIREAEHRLFPGNGENRQISFKDGWLVIDVKEKIGKSASRYFEGKVTKVADNFRWKTEGGLRGANVGCNPVGYLFRQITTDYDIEVIEWAIDKSFDVFSQSFVCHPIDAFLLRCILAHNAKRKGLKPAEVLTWPLIGKVETAPAVSTTAAERYLKEMKRDPENKMHELIGRYKLTEEPEFDQLRERFKDLCRIYLKSPIESLAMAFDGLMAARGDLAVEVQKVTVPNRQRELVRACRQRSKCAIIATEVLPSMQRGLPSTRAEIGDINTTVVQEADVVMLGGEVASMELEDPLEEPRPENVVSELRNALLAAEEDRRLRDRKRNFEARQKEMEGADKTNGGHDKKIEKALKRRLSMGARVCNAARTADAPAIFASVTSGATAIFISDFSPPQPVVAITSNRQTARWLLLHQGIYPVLLGNDFDHTIESLVDILHDSQGFFVKDIDNVWPRSDHICPALIRLDKVAGEHVKEMDQAGRQPNSICEISLPGEHREVKEIEWKYLLSEVKFGHLEQALKSQYPCKILTQTNLYFTDHERKLKKISLRLRLEEQRGEAETRVFFTWKAPDIDDGQQREFEMRPEAEYDVTRIYFKWLERQGPNADFINFSIQDLSTYWPTIIERSKLFGVQLPTNPKNLHFECIGRLRNVRLLTVMKVDLQLELDCWRPEWDEPPPEGFPQGFFDKRYELEIEDREENAERVKEVVHNLLASLNIPVRIGKLPKMVMALLRSGEIPADAAGGKILKIKEDDQFLLQAKGHMINCRRCRKILDH